MSSNLNRIFTVRYIGLLTVLAVLIALSYLNLAQLIDAEEGSAARINMAGRQRMLSQRIWGLSEALARAGDDSESSDIRDRLQSAIALMDRSHEGLLDSASDSGAPATLDDEIRTYLQLAREIQGLPTEEIAGRVGELGKQGESLLFDLDTVVRALQDRSEQAAIELRHRAALVTVFMWILLAVSVFGIFQPLIRKLLEANGRLRILSSELALAEQEERRRFSDELHEDVLQIVTAAKMQLAIVEGEDDDSREGRLRKAEQMLASAAAAIRTQAFELGPPVLYSLGLPPAVRSLAIQLSNESGIDIKVEEVSEFGPPLPDPLRIILFRAIRELLTNVLRHSEASEATVFFRPRNSSLEIEVRDNGVGFDLEKLDDFSAEAPRFGLLAIRERLAYLGSELQIDSRPGKGTSVHLRIERPT